MNLLDSARHLGGLRAVELACFRRLGEQAPRLVAPAYARWAASASLAHAWRASLLEDLLPVSPRLPSLEELTVLPAGPLGDALSQALPEPDEAWAASPGDSPGDDGWRLLARLSGRFYPLLLADYRHRLAICSPAADGALVRTIGRAVADLETVRAEGDALVKLDSTVTLTFGH